MFELRLSLLVFLLSSCSARRAAKSNRECEMTDEIKLRLNHTFLLINIKYKNTNNNTINAGKGRKINPYITDTKTGTKPNFKIILNK